MSKFLSLYRVAIQLAFSALPPSMLCTSWEVILQYLNKVEISSKPLTEHPHPLQKNQKRSKFAKARSSIFHVEINKLV